MLEKSSATAPFVSLYIHLVRKVVIHFIIFECIPYNMISYS